MSENRTTKSLRLWQLLLAQAVGFAAVIPITAAVLNGRLGLTDFEFGGLYGVLLLRCIDAVFAYQHEKVV